MATSAKTKCPDEGDIVTTVCVRFADVQAIYLFGSVADGTANVTSDLDLALLLSPKQARKEKKNLFMDPLHKELQSLAGRNVDLLNLRKMPTVLQKEIVMEGRRIYCRDQLAADEFELTVLSRYQRLNHERAEILAQFEASGRAYDV